MRVVAALLLFVASNVFAQSYRVDDLGVGLTTAINERGVVAGFAYGDPEWYAFTWSVEEGLQRLPAPPNLRYLSVAMNNHRSEVVAAAREPGNSQWCLIKWTLGEMEQLPVCASGNAFHGPAINDFSQIVFSQEGRAIRLDPDGKIISFGEVNSSGTGINNRGQWVGFYTTDTGSQRAFIHSDEAGFQELPLPAGGINSWADAISENGMVAGRVEFANGRIDAVIWRGDSIVNMTESWVWSLFRPATINSSGTVVGYIGFGFVNLGTFIYSDEEGIQGLNALIEPRWGVTSPRWSINDNGQIAGQAYNGRFFRAVRLLPIK